MEEDKIEDLVFDPLQYEALERDSQETLEELRKISALNGFLAEYEKLAKAMKKGHESEMRLVQRCKILIADRKRAVLKIQSAMNIAIEDSGTIETFQKEKEALQKALDEAKAHTVYLKEATDQLKLDLADRSKLLASGPELSGEYKRTLSELTAKKAQLIKDRDAIFKKLNDSRKDQGEATERNVRLRQDVQGVKKQIEGVERQSDDKRQEIEVQKQRKIRADEEAKRLKHEIDEINSLIVNEQKEAAAVTASISQMAGVVSSHNADIEKKQQEIVAVQEQKAKAEADLKREKERVAQLRAENDSVMKEIGEVRKKIAETQQQTAECRRSKDRMTQQLKQVEARRAELEKERIKERDQLHNYEEELEAQERANKDARLLVETYEKKLLLLQKKVVSDAQETKKKEELKELALMEKRFVESHIANAKGDLEKLKREIEQFEAEKGKYEGHLREAQDWLTQQTKAKDGKMEVITKAQLSVDEQAAKLRQQQTLLETVQTERNLGSRRLISAQESNQEQQAKFVALEQEITQLKETIKQSDKALLEENMKLDQIVASAKVLRKKVVEYEAQLAVAEETVNGHKDQIKQLQQIIATSEAQMHREEEEYKHVMGERQVLSAQLIKRDQELASLYEKMILQQATLEKGENQYNTTVEQMQITKERVIALKAQVDALTARVSLLDELKREAIRLEADIRAEQLKIRGMEDELAAPINAHRWRILESVDPECIDILNRIHILQKKLIVVADELTAKTSMIDEAEKAAAQLTTLLKKQPGRELKEEVEQARAQLKEKEGRLKVIDSELKAVRDEAAGYTSQISDLNAELESLQTQYLQKMKSSQ
ncbi:putative flagellar associated protein [Monocercomonoides exilis]|uniref:putative flagellar associated protein n=1 Tax=Monocercomonoides exilis TaxID=2049356 RepID=UPI00355A8B75|nr:putative flagellar associated protein [Monocercomonoides exilis]|eukprot:MONOS_8025.1-p1 / transcript=MONOS_8025.1 / gene=MONOS_8025 / organism=Monocercomonoides_exilis_PA203 / gene_product=flagellar associated protein / transcript_product=flagellar associated protein / location=Mono_scaffold00291:49996-52900(-) / protein_length=834 / sequence_SO=supercontig / SO=protein_coding / is_pseudo=false